MSAEVNHFAFGPVSPVLALLSAALGCLLGIILATRSQKFTGRKRVRLLLYASISLGVTGIWQAKVVRAAGPGRAGHDPALRPEHSLAASLGVALVASAGGMFVLGYGRTGFWRLLAAGLLFGGAVVGAHALIMRSLEWAEPSPSSQRWFWSRSLWRWVWRAGCSGSCSAPADCARRWARRPLRVWPSCAAHYVGEAAIEVNLGAGTAAGVSGLSSMQVALLTLVLGTALIAMMWFFTVGTATRRDLHAIFDPLDDSGQIEPWMIEHVTARIALTTTGDMPVVPDHASVAAPTVRATYVPGGSPIAGAFAGPLPGRRELGPRPTPGITPVWRTMPVWGRPEVTSAPEPGRAWASRNAVAARLQDRNDPSDLAAQQSPRGPADAVHRARVAGAGSPAPRSADRGASAAETSSSRPGPRRRGIRHVAAARPDTARRCRDATAGSRWVTPTEYASRIPRRVAAGPDS